MGNFFHKSSACSSTSTNPSRLTDEPSTVSAATLPHRVLVLDHSMGLEGAPRACPLDPAGREGLTRKTRKVVKLRT